MINTLNKDIQDALKCGRWHDCKLDGKLLGYKPKKGQVAVLNNGAKGIILKECNGVGDYLIDFGNNLRERFNIRDGQVIGYIDQ